VQATFQTASPPAVTPLALKSLMSGFISCRIFSALLSQQNPLFFAGKLECAVGEDCPPSKLDEFLAQVSFSQQIKLNYFS
jgi:hypothetical protein